MNPILALENITYQYTDGTIALKNLTFAVNYGKKIALLGNNGAGKSTLFSLLNGIFKATSGTFVFEGKPFTYSRKEIKRLRQQVGVVFQDPDAQLFSSSVYEDIKFGPRNIGLVGNALEESVNKAIELTETASLKDKPPHFLSIGEKKRVAIAGVLAMNPTLMVLDEPTAGLDPYYSKKIITILNNLHHSERTIMLSTHDVDLAFEWADEVILLHDGELLSVGSPIDIFRNKEVMEKSHLEKPWVLEVYERIKGKIDTGNQSYPLSKDELFQLLDKIL